MSKKLLTSGTRNTLEKVGLEPVYSKGGILIYEVGSDLYMLTNETNQFNFTGNKVQTCEKWPDFCISN